MINSMEDCLIDSEKNDRDQKRVDLLAPFLVQLCGLTVDYFRLKTLSMIHVSLRHQISFSSSF